MQQQFLYKCIRGNRKSAINQYQKRGNRSESQSLVPAKVSIGQECSEQGGKICGTIEDVNESCCRDTFHVEYGCQIYQEVGGSASSPQLFKSFISCVLKYV